MSDELTTLEQLEEIDRNARAYGWEIGNGHPLAERIEELSDDNPFLDKKWREKMMKVIESHPKIIATEPAIESEIGTVNGW